MMNIEHPETKKKIRFIINPISGGKKKDTIVKKISEIIDQNLYSYDIKYTQYRFHATELTQDALNQGFHIVVAVGGDGTINEITKALIYSNVIFGIIPVGSGNGLARFLKIPLKIDKAITTINKSKVFRMDSVQINDHFFVNMAGIGFDAHISYLFSESGKRGFKSYVRLIFKEFFKYTNKTYELMIDNKAIEINAFLISFANSSQFGNNAHIAPLAEINDGLIDICILKKFAKWKSILILLLMYSKKLNRSKYYRLIKAKEVEITNPSNLKMHIDGDPIEFNSIARIKIHPESLNIIVP
jgi:diacylglycerol kinase (ATP)